MERYYSFGAYCENTFGRKLYKIPLDAGMTCPNRDGIIGTGGCIFCDEGGSGDFASKYHGEALHPETMEYVRNNQSDDQCFIGYFQAYTNTYAPIEKLDFLFSSALRDPMLKGISIATRPDCLGEDVITLLADLKKRFPDKFIWVELGLQTMHEETAEFIHRGYKLPVFESAVMRLNAMDIPVIVHVILGLPQESEEMMYKTICYLNTLPIQGIKLQLLHVLKNTKLAQLYEAGEFEVLREEEYLRIVTGCIARLREDIVVHRMTGDGNKEILIAPLWSAQKKRVLNAIGHELKVRNIRQGCMYGKEQYTD